MKNSVPGRLVLKLRPLMVFPLDDELAVFSEERQIVLGLNASATFLFRNLQRGLTEEELTAAVVSAGLTGLAEAQSWVATTIDAFRSHGILCDGETPDLASAKQDQHQSASDQSAAGVRPYAPFNPAFERRYRLLETSLLIRFGHPAQLPVVESVIGHLFTDGNSLPTVVMDIAAIETDGGELRSDIYRDGKPVGYAPRLSRIGANR